jgi:alkanesulfonate monooxygenase SsuD/methylene tetrahydromethanopterin reductase-like flavin-dependent oxidoreductase (luciferase family)
LDRVAAACRAIGRDPGTVLRSAALTTYVGKDDAQVRGRVDAMGQDLDRLRTSGLAGTPAEVVDRIGQWQEATRVQRIYLQLLDLRDLEQIELIAAEVVPQLS